MACTLNNYFIFCLLTSFFRLALLPPSSSSSSAVPLLVLLPSLARAEGPVLEDLAPLLGVLLPFL